MANLSFRHSRLSNFAQGPGFLGGHAGPKNPDLRPHADAVPKDAAGCDVAYMGGGVIATLTAPGNDPVCTSQTGAVLQFRSPS
jgi:hypothetical protein